MKTEIETQLRDYWDSVYEAFPELDADEIRFRPAQVHPPSRRRGFGWRPVWVAAVAALLTLALVGGAAMLFGSAGPIDPADEAETDSDLLLDYPTSQVPPFRAEVLYVMDGQALTDAGHPTDDLEVVVTVSYGAPGRFRVELNEDIPFAAAGSFTVVRDAEAGEYLADDRSFVLTDKDPGRDPHPLEPFVWETWDDLCTFGEHAFLEPEVVAGRDTVRLRCTKGDDTYDLWVDVETGLVLRAVGDEVPTTSVPAFVPAVSFEVLSVEYQPLFSDGLFDLVAPPGAEVEDFRGSGEDVPAPGWPLEGLPVPGLKGTTLDGAAFDLTELRGSRVAILFWASWCSPCLDALEDVAAVAAVRDDVVFVTVLILQNQPDDARAALQERGIDLPTIEPLGLSTNEYEEAWGLLGIPHLVLVERDGTGAGMLAGYGPFLSVEGLFRDAGW